MSRDLEMFVGRTCRNEMTGGLSVSIENVRHWLLYKLGFLVLEPPLFEIFITSVCITMSRVTPITSNVPLRSYISASVFANDIFSYDSDEGLEELEIDEHVAKKGRVLRETGRKLYPNVHRVRTYMVGVYDAKTLITGFIDPNSPTFSVYNSDKPTYLQDGKNPNSDGEKDLGAPVITKGDSTFKNVEIISDGELEVKGRTKLNKVKVESDGELEVSKQAKFRLRGDSIDIDDIYFFGDCVPIDSAGTNDGQTPSSIVVGVKVKVLNAGKVTGVRFYKPSGDNGINQGLLYSADGSTQLQQTPTINVSPPGWHTLPFLPATSFEANDEFIVAMYNESGYYVNDFFSGELPLTNWPIEIKEARYDYTSSAHCPTTNPSPSYNQNYYVEPVWEYPEPQDTFTQVDTNTGELSFATRNLKAYGAKRSGLAFFSNTSSVAVISVFCEPTSTIIITVQQSYTYGGANTSPIAQLPPANYTVITGSNTFTIYSSNTADCSIVNWTILN